MRQLKAGQTLWSKFDTLRLDGTILTQVECTSNIKQLPWHYHENFLFYYHLSGTLNEVSRKKTITCSAGTLLLHHWQDPHYDEKFSKDARFFHLEIENEWFSKHNIRPDILEGSFELQSPILKTLFRKIHREINLNDTTSQISVDGLLLQSIAEISRAAESRKSGVPSWVAKVREILNDTCGERITLDALSLETGIHPVHLSRQFPKYFNAGFGDYIRALRVERAAKLLAANHSMTLAQIGFECGFADQSHFIRCFKEKFGITPLQYQKNISKR